MLRALVGLLLVANLAFYAWSQGWLDNVVGVRAEGEHEPERLAHQVHPELVTIVTPQAVAAAASAAEARLVCLEAGPFATDAAASAAQAAVAAVLPAGSWSAQKTDVAGAWMLYMGKYSPETMTKKQDELTRMHVPFETLQGAPALEPGLSLGRFSDAEAAATALAQLTRRGVHTARVVELAKPASTQTLRVARAEPELAAKVSALKLDALGKGFEPCKAR